MNYYLLENFLTQQNNNIIINEETRDDFVDFLYEINDKEISEVNEEELGKYFCFKIQIKMMKIFLYYLLLII